MLRPAMSQIIKKNDNYYEFVVAVAKRAREIADDSEEEHLILEEKPVKLAVEELATGRYKIRKNSAAE